MRVIGTQFITNSAINSMENVTSTGIQQETFNNKYECENEWHKQKRFDLDGRGEPVKEN